MTRSHAFAVRPYTITGRLLAVRGPALVAALPGAVIGETALVERGRRPPLLCRVGGFDPEGIRLIPMGHTDGVGVGAKVILKDEVGPSKSKPALGHVYSGTGVELASLTPKTPGAITSAEMSSGDSDLAGGRTDFASCSAQHLREHASAIEDFPRPVIRRQLVTGVPAIDLFLPLGEGQRIAIFAEPGVGKTSLLFSIATGGDFDAFVIAVIGERRRELDELVTCQLPDQVRARCVVFASTSDEAAQVKINAAELAMQTAEWFRASGMRVLLAIDSLTRLCRSYRETGLAAGEIPVRHGYPPSAFAELPRLLERAGPGRVGSITGLFSVLTTSDISPDPFEEEVRSILDGHVFLSKRLAEAGRYPAIDLLSSISRLSHLLLSGKESHDVALLKALLARAEEDRELFMFGARPDRELEVALKFRESIFEAAGMGYSTGLMLSKNTSSSKKDVSGMDRVEELKERRTSLGALAEKIRQELGR